MPLNKGAKPGSKEFGENIATEEKAGKPAKQAEAIAYSTAKDASGKVAEFMRWARKNADDAHEYHWTDIQKRWDMTEAEAKEARATFEQYQRTGSKKDAAIPLISARDAARSLLPNDSKMDRAMAKADALARKDASPEMLAFQARQADRIRKAEAGERRGEALKVRVKNARRMFKAAGSSPAPGRQADAEQLVKRATAAFGLAKDVSDQRKHESWLSMGETQMAEAESAVNDLEAAAARVSRTDAVNAGQPETREEMEEKLEGLKKRRDGINAEEREGRLGDVEKEIAETEEKLKLASAVEQDQGKLQHDGKPPKAKKNDGAKLDSIMSRVDHLLKETDNAPAKGKR